MNRTILVVLAALVVLVVAVGGVLASTYNGLVGSEQAVVAQWAQVENVYQRRADLIPNLVSTVKGAAQFEQDTLTAVTEARARVGSVQVGPEVLEDPAAFQQFQQSQDQLSSALSRLLVVSEAYPTLTATQGFRELQAQLEGSENRITVERQRFNEAARDYNTKVRTFPTVFFAGMLGFEAKEYFQATSGAERAPEVKF